MLRVISLFPSFFQVIFSFLDGLAWGSKYGRYIGPLSDTVPGVTGDLYAVDKATIFVANFSHPGLDKGEQFQIKIRFLFVFKYL